MSKKASTKSLGMAPVSASEPDVVLLKTKNRILPVPTCEIQFHSFFFCLVCRFIASKFLHQDLVAYFLLLSQIIQSLHCLLRYGMPDPYTRYLCTILVDRHRHVTSSLHVQTLERSLRNWEVMSSSPVRVMTASSLSNKHGW